MPKIGTAHIELKPVLNEEALDQIAERIEAAVKAGVEAGIAAARPPIGEVHFEGAEDFAQFAARIKPAKGDGFRK